MNQPFHILDSVVLLASAVATAATTLVLQESAPAAQQTAEVQLLLLPFLGAVILTGGIIMLNPQIETRKIVIGRCFIAGFFGVLMPQIMGMFHPALASQSLRPVVLVLAGGIFSVIAYVLSRPFTEQAYARATGVAGALADKIERQTLTTISTKETKTAAPTPTL